MPVQLLWVAKAMYISLKGALHLPFNMSLYTSDVYISIESLKMSSAYTSHSKFGQINDPAIQPAEQHLFFRRIETEESSSLAAAASACSCPQRRPPRTS
jgi:hypothetical protein